MRYRNYLLALIAVLLGLEGCTSSRWMVQKQRVVDTANGLILDSHQVILPDTNITPDHPILTLKLMNINKVKYSERLKLGRYIQRYRPRYGYLFLGLAGTGFLLYTAHFSGLKMSKADRRIMDGAAVLLSASSALDMKPVGKAKPTGETRLSKKTGSVVRTDTVLDKLPKNKKAYLTAFYHKRLLANDLPVEFNDGAIKLDLVRNINLGTITSENPGNLDIHVEYLDTTYTFRVPVNHFTKRYALVIRPKASLHGSPVNNESNVITDVGYKTQLRFVSKVGKKWYKVLYGITPTYLSTSDAELVWKPSGNIVAPNVFVIPHAKFGDIDVEQNIPVDSVKNHNAVGLLLNNTFYGPDSNKVQTIYSRDIELMKQYMIRTLGVDVSHVKVFGNTDEQKFEQFLGNNGQSGGISQLVNSDSTDLYVYYVGQRHFLPPKKDSSSSSNLGKILSPMQRMINDISRLNTKKTFVFVDVNFNRSDLINEYDNKATKGRLIQKILFQTAQNAVSSNTNMDVIFSSDLDQPAGIYKAKDNSVDKRHSIFTYYLCQSLKQGDNDIFNIYRYLQRNVTFTSRSLFDRAQDPVIFGNLNMELKN